MTTEQRNRLLRRVTADDETLAGLVLVIAEEEELLRLHLADGRRGGHVVVGQAGDGEPANGVADEPRQDQSCLTPSASGADPAS